MNEDMQFQEFHRTNVIIWIAIIVTVVILSLIVYFLDTMKYFQPVENSPHINQIIFFMAEIRLAEPWGPP